MGVDLAHVHVDWAAGLVIASGVGIADRHAPTPASAREPARRAAEDAARKQLLAALPTLPLATGGTLAGKLADATAKARLEAAINVAVAAAITVDTVLETDGSWNVTLAVPLEAVRQAEGGPRVFATADSDPPVVIVEGVTAKPAVGYAIGGVSGATVWVSEVPKWAKDAPHVKATSTKPGAIELARKQGGPSTLFVLVKP
ncbi:MAG: hypothetical protein H6Q90_2268 [Deltaproteobacteria bacterium]|nr:hypothetical protein [Deltaproteobacteria bacterium]